MSVTEAVEQALSANPARPAYFVTIEFPGFTFRAWSGLGTKYLEGSPFVGCGNLGQIGPISERSDLAAQKLQMSLSGLSSALSLEVQQYAVQGSPVRVVQAQLDGNDQIIPDAFDVFIGEIDVPSETFGDVYTITLQVENYLSFMFRGPDGRRRTAADQQALFPNSGDPDVGLQFVGYLLQSIPWGVKTGITKNTGGTSAGSGAATYAGG